MHSFEFLSTTF